MYLYYTFINDPFVRLLLNCVLSNTTQEAVSVTAALLLYSFHHYSLQAEKWTANRGWCTSPMRNVKPLSRWLSVWEFSLWVLKENVTWNSSFNLMFLPIVSTYWFWISHLQNKCTMGHHSRNIVYAGGEYYIVESHVNIGSTTRNKPFLKKPNLCIYH